LINLLHLAEEIAGKPLEELRSWLFQYVITGDHRKTEELLNAIERERKRRTSKKEGKEGEKGNKETKHKAEVGAEMFDLNRVSRTGTYMHMAAR